MRPTEFSMRPTLSLPICLMLYWPPGGIYLAGNEAHKNNWRPRSDGPGSHKIGERCRTDFQVSEGWTPGMSQRRFSESF